MCHEMSVEVWSSYMWAQRRYPGSPQLLFLSYVKSHKPVSSQRLAKGILGYINTSLYKAHSVRGASSTVTAAKGVLIEDILHTADWNLSEILLSSYSVEQLCSDLIPAKSRSFPEIIELIFTVIINNTGYAPLVILCWSLYLFILAFCANYIMNLCTIKLMIWRGPEGPEVKSRVRWANVTLVFLLLQHILQQLVALNTIIN